MDIEYLECEIDVIDLPECAGQDLDGPGDETTAEAIFTKWFTDWRARNTTPSNVIAS